MTPTRSLQYRLNLGLSLPLGALLLILWGLTAAVMQRLASDLVAARLEHDAEGLLQALERGPNGSWSLDPERLPPIYRQPLSGHYYLVLNDATTLRSRSLWDEKLETPRLSPGERLQSELPGPRGEPILLWSAGYEKLGTPLTISVAESLGAAESLMHRFHLVSGLLILLTIALSLITQRLVVKRSLASLETLRQELSDLEQGRVAALTEQVPQEVQPLVREVNHLLQLLAQRLERSRNALGNLAHALKGPLNLISQSLQSNTPGSGAELRGELEPQIAQLRTLIERELKRARLVGNPSPGRWFDANAELPVLLQLLQRMHPERRISLRLPPATRLPADRDDMLELFGNLLDNACKWARQEIRCTIEPTADGPLILIEDDGPGCDLERLGELTRRGSRLDESREGHGLGLAIVADLVAVYRGILRFDRSRLGGLRVEVLLKGRQR